jgi:hypothetical protein
LVIVRQVVEIVRGSAAKAVVIVNFVRVVVLEIVRVVQIVRAEVLVIVRQVVEIVRGSAAKAVVIVNFARVVVLEIVRVVQIVRAEVSVIVQRAVETGRGSVLKVLIAHRVVLEAVAEMNAVLVNRHSIERVALLVLGRNLPVVSDPIGQDSGIEKEAAVSNDETKIECLSGCFGYGRKTSGYYG